MRCVDAIGSGPLLDPFLGSGTTAIAAETRGYDWAGIDISAKYCEMALHRTALI
jgi:DNA modification methylase